MHLQIATTLVLAGLLNVAAETPSFPDAADKYSARYAATVAVDANTAGRSALIFQTTDHASSRYVRGTNGWATVFDLSCVAIYNSLGAQLATNSCCPWEAPTRRGGTLISPRHFLCAHHYLLPPGTKLRFVSPQNVVVTRTVMNSTNIIGSDLEVGVLDFDVPPGAIGFARVLPPDFQKYFPSLLTGIPALCFNKTPECLVSDIATLVPPANPTVISYAVPTDPTRKFLYSPKISGDSGQPSFLILDGQLVLLTVWTGGGPGSGNFVTGFYDQINTAMKYLGGPHQLTPVDLSRYTRY